MIRRLTMILLLAACCFAVAQEKPVEAAKPDAAANAANQATPSAQLAEASKEAAGEENAEFKQSPTVKWLANATGMSPKTAYWVFVSINFIVIAGAVAFLWKSNVPAAFRMRTETIRKGMDEARRASDEATRRLKDVESRLARLDAEIGSMRAHAEQEAAAEEQRIRAAAEEDKNKIISAAEAEIEAAAKQARRELKAFAAGLAVTLAEQRIRVDETTDRALVQTFVSDLGENGGGK